MDWPEFRHIFLACMLNIVLNVQAQSISFCPAPQSSLGRFTDSCSKNSECLTNYCYNSKCACPSNTYYHDCKFSCVPNCGANIPATSGDIVSHGYPFSYVNSEHCTWTLNGNPRTYFVLSLTDVDLEGSCGFDSLEVYNGPSPSSVRLAQWCNRNDTSVKVVSTTTNAMHIVFRTDLSNVFRGFSGSYRLYDYNAWINQSIFGYIASPGYPLSYPRSSYFSWTIDGGIGKFISLRIMSFNLGDASNCSYKYVQVYDGLSNSSKTLYKMCSISYPPVLLSSASYLHVVFKTDSSNEHSGFAASYQVQDCHFTLANTSGYIASPGFPAQYSGNLYCTWTIIAPPDKFISLSVSDFQLETNINCTYDYLKIYDGRYITAPLLLGTYCNTAPPKIISTTNSLLLVFKTDVSDHYRGFSGTFTTDEGRPYNFKCNVTSQCNQHLVCVAGICGCRPGFYFNKGTYLCNTALDHGITCDPRVPNMCSGPSLECKSDTYGDTRCLCLSGLFMRANQCYPVEQLGVVPSNDSLVGTNEVQLNWTSRLQISHINHTIKWRTTDDAFIGGEMIANQNGIHVSGLIPGQEYIFTVFSELEALSYYPETLFTTNLMFETRPVTPAKLNESNSQLKSSPYILRFELPEGRAANYRITLGAKVYDVNKTELTTDELTPDTQYNYTINAYNKHGDSSGVVTGNFTTGPAEITDNDADSQVNIPLIAGITSGVIVAVIIIIVVVAIIVRRRKLNRSKDQGRPKMTDADHNVVVAAGPSASDSSGDIKMVDYRSKNIVDIRTSSAKNNHDERLYDCIRDSEITLGSEGIYANIGGIEGGKWTANTYSNNAFVNDRH